MRLINANTKGKYHSCCDVIISPTRQLPNHANSNLPLITWLGIVQPAQPIDTG